MPSPHPRVQVTVDPELARAMDAIEAQPPSRSRLIRDLALAGARAEREAQDRRREAGEHLIRIARGDEHYDFAALRAIHAEREAGFD